MKKKILIGKKIRHLCIKHDVKFIVNDDPILAKKLNADGCHLGQKDMNIKDAKKIIGRKIIGITCHNSVKLQKKQLKIRLITLHLVLFSNKNKKS